MPPPICRRLRLEPNLGDLLTTTGNSEGAATKSSRAEGPGSIAFVAAARAAFAVVEDPENEGRRLLLQAKNNLGPKCEGLAFRVEQRLIEDEILASSVFFESEHVAHSLDQALAASENRGGGVAPGRIGRNLIGLECAVR